MKRSLFLSLMILVLFCTSCRRGEKGTICARVVDRVTGRALFFADIRIPNSGKEAIADSFGYYYIGDVPAGSCTLVTSMKGYLPETAFVNVSASEADTLDIALSTPWVGGTILGTVTERSSGKPLSDILVSLAGKGPGGYTDSLRYSGGYTESLGYYCILNVPPGPYRMVATSMLYCPESTDVLVVPNETTAVNLDLVACAGRISGKVTDVTTGEPLSGARIRIFDSRGKPHESVGSHGSGKYSSRGKVPGIYRLVARKDCYARSDTIDVRVEKGQVASVNFSLRLLPHMGRVSGKVLDNATNQPVAHANIRLPDIRKRVYCDGSGYYNICLAVGTYAIVASKRGYAKSESTVWVTEDETSTLDFCISKLVTGMIFGTVTDLSTREPLSRVRVSVRKRLGYTIETHSNRDGHYFVTEVPIGIYTVGTSLKGYAREYRKDVLVAENGTTAVDVVLRPIGYLRGAVCGRVADDSTGQPLPGAGVRIDDVGQTHTDKFGNYRFLDVPPGTHTVRASARDYLKSEAVNVRVMVHDTTTIDFNLRRADTLCVTYGERTGKIAGRVVDASTGKPLPFVNVYVPDLKIGAVSDTSGYYYVLNVPPGNHSVLARLMGYEEFKATDVRVKAEQTTTVNVRLQQMELPGFPKRRKKDVCRKAWEFALADQEGEVFKLSDFEGKRVLLSFHPLAWTDISSRQMKSLEKRRETLDSLNTIAVGISVDAVASKKAWAKSLGLKNTRLLSDFWPQGVVAKRYDVFNDIRGFSKRANIIIDEDQNIVFSKIYKMTELPDIDEVIDSLRCLDKR